MTRRFCSYCQTVHERRGDQAYDPEEGVSLMRFAPLLLGAVAFWVVFVAFLWMLLP